MKIDNQAAGRGPGHVVRATDQAMPRTGPTRATDHTDHTGHGPDQATDQSGPDHGPVQATGHGPDQATGPTTIPTSMRIGINIGLSGIIAAAMVSIWGGWVELGHIVGFGAVQPLPGTPLSHVTVDLAITLPIGAEALLALCVPIALASGSFSARTRRFSWTAMVIMTLVGMTGQVSYHLLTAWSWSTPPTWLVIGTSCLPITNLLVATILVHMVRADMDHADRATDQATDYVNRATDQPMSPAMDHMDRATDQATDQMDRSMSRPMNGRSSPRSTDHRPWTTGHVDRPVLVHGPVRSMDHTDHGPQADQATVRSDPGHGPHGPRDAGHGLVQPGPRTTRATDHGPDQVTEIEDWITSQVRLGRPAGQIDEEGGRRYGRAPRTLKRYRLEIAARQRAGRGGGE